MVSAIKAWSERLSLSLDLRAVNGPNRTLVQADTVKERAGITASYGRDYAAIFGNRWRTSRTPSLPSLVRVRLSRQAHWLTRLMWLTPVCRATWLESLWLVVSLRMELLQLVPLKAHLQVITNRRTNGENIESASANRTMGRGRAPGKAISLDYQAANVQGQTGDSGLAKALTDFVSTGAGVYKQFQDKAKDLGDERSNEIIRKLTPQRREAIQNGTLLYQDDPYAMEQLRVKTGSQRCDADDEINVQIQNGEFRTRGRWRSIATSDFRMPLSLTLKRLASG
ncbi:internal virion protein [Enterobacter phage 01_vB_Eclo_IJM]|nr:internal virion protein [Enterobacter phage 01_vB_Eclo_IJM]